LTDDEGQLSLNASDDIDPSLTPLEERQLRGESEVLDSYVSGLQKRSPGRGVLRLRRLLAMRRTYPQQAFIATIEKALQYGLYDLHRLEHLILEQVAGDFIQIAPDEQEPEFWSTALPIY
jgi:hypothetical protein